MLSIEDASLPTPALVGVDTSFVFEALVVGQRLHVACQDYLARLAQDGRELVVSDFLEVELREASFKYALIARHGSKRWKTMRNDGRARRGASRFMRSVVDAWNEALQYVPHRVVDAATVRSAIPRLMERYGLASYDAIHAATAIHAGVDGFVTIDAGFGNVPEAELTLYVDASRLASCRRRRF